MLMPFVEPAKTLRESLSWMVSSGWIDAVMQWRNFAPADDTFRRENGTSPTEMMRRFESYHAAFRAFVEKVREENLWDTEWVDADCDPPHTFAIGAVLEETLTWDIAYRLMLHKQLDQFGFAEDHPNIK